MKSFFNGMGEVDIIAKLADLREVDYHNTLVLHSIIEILIEKGVLTREEILAKARQLDSQPNHQAIPLEQLDGNPHVAKAKHAPHL